MANLVEFLVKVKDLASGPLQKIAGTGNKSFTQLEQKLTGFSSRFSRLSMSINDIDKKLDQLRRTREISVDSRQLKRINQEMDQLERRKAKLEGGGMGGSGLGSISGLAAGALGMAGIAGLGGVVGMGMDKTLTNTSYEVMAGKKTGSDLSSNLQNYAQDTIYGKEVLGIGQTMLGFGVNAKAVMPTMERLGDIATGNAEKFKSLGLVFSQVAAQGRLMGSDNLQFINAGFNPLQVISEKTGKSMGVLKKEMEEGKITFMDVAGAIETATNKGGRFFNMTNNLAETAPGKLLGLQGSIEGLAATVGVGLLEAMSPLIDLGQWFVDAPEMIFGFLGAIAALTVGIGIWRVVTQWAAISQWLLNIAVMWPVVLIAVLAGAIVMLVSKYQGWGKAMNSLWVVIKAWCSNVGIGFKDAFQEIGFKLEWLILKVKGGFQFISSTVGNFMRALKLASEFKFGEAKEALTAEIKTKASAEIETLERTRKSQRAKNLSDFAANLSTMQNTGVWNKLTLRNGKKGKSLTDPKDFMSSLGGPEGTITAPSVASDTAGGISGGGVRSITITVGKFFDDLHFHSSKTSSNEMQDVEDKVIEMFMRITNSGNAALR